MESETRGKKKERKTEGGGVSRDQTLSDVP